MIFTVSKIISGLIDCVFSMGALLIVMLFTGGEFTWRLFLFPLVLAQNFVFTMGLGLFLAATNALPQNLQYIVSHLNPMYSYVSQFRMLTLPGFVPVGISIMWLIIIGIVSAFLMLIIGLWVFVKTQDKFILYI